jgi:hypothetical protein
VQTVTDRIQDITAENTEATATRTSRARKLRPQGEA